MASFKSAGWQFKLEQMIALPFIVIAIALNVIHPFIHGTFIDGGLWDGALGYIDMIASYFSSNRG